MKGLILVGGQSQRMGTDKYLMNIHGVPQYLYLYELMSSLGLEVFVSCNETQVSSIDIKIPKIVDKYEAIGPMGGIISAFESDSETSWLVVACDLMNLSKETIVFLLDAQDKAMDIVAYKKPAQPFFETTMSIYNPGAFQYLSQQVAKGQYSLQSVFKMAEVKALIPADEETLKNFNHPKDLL